MESNNQVIHHIWFHLYIITVWIVICMYFRCFSIKAWCIGVALVTVLELFTVVVSIVVITFFVFFAILYTVSIVVISFIYTLHICVFTSRSAKKKVRQEKILVTLIAVEPTIMTKYRYASKIP